MTVRFLLTPSAAAARVDVSEEAIAQAILDSQLRYSVLADGEITIYEDDLLAWHQGLIWRHRVVSGGVSLWVTLTESEPSVTVSVTGSAASIAIDHVDSKRLIPADLTNRRIVTDELATIVGDALEKLPVRVPDTTYRALVRDIRKNFR